MELTEQDKIQRLARAMYRANNPSSNWDRDARSVAGFYLAHAERWLAAREEEKSWE